MTSTIDTSSSLSSIPNIEEIAISIAAKNLNPTMLSQEFLKASAIIPNDWEPSKQPVLNPRGSQITFKNGVNIVAQPNSINFAEGLANKKPEQLQIPLVAGKYIEKLPMAEYQGINISPKSLIPFPQDPDAARKFITQTLLAKGPWLEFGTGSVQAGVNLFYQLENSQFTLNINQARLQQQDKPAIGALLFAGSFSYNIGKFPEGERLNGMIQIIKDWQKNLQTFRELVYQKFLQKPMPSENVVPSGNIL